MKRSTIAHEKGTGLLEFERTQEEAEKKAMIVTGGAVEIYDSEGRKARFDVIRPKYRGKGKGEKGGKKGGEVMTREEEEPMSELAILQREVERAAFRRQASELLLRMRKEKGAKSTREEEENVERKKKD